MKNYIVVATVTSSIEVEAENESEALAKANDIFEDDGLFSISGEIAIEAMRYVK